MRERTTEATNPIEQEFLSVIREYERVIYKVCYLYTNPNAPLNDLYQDVILNLWKAYPKFRRECKMSTWIYRIALNTCISFFRKEKNVPEIVTLTREADWIIEEHDPIHEMLRQRRYCGDHRTDGDKCGYQTEPYQRQTKKNEKGVIIYGTGRTEKIMECPG